MSKQRLNFDVAEGCGSGCNFQVLEFPPLKYAVNDVWYIARRNNR